MTLKGIPGAPGIGIGTAQVLKKELDIPRFALEDSKEELDRFYRHWIRASSKFLNYSRGQAKTVTKMWQILCKPI